MGAGITLQIILLILSQPKKPPLFPNKSCERTKCAVITCYHTSNISNSILGFREMHYLEMCCVFNEQLNFWRLLVPWSMLRKADALNLVIKWVWNLCKCNNWGFHLCHKIVFKQGLNTDDIIDKLPELQLKWSNVYGCVLVDPEPCCSGKPRNHEGICIYSSGCQNEQCLKASTGRLLGCRTLAYRKNAKCDEYNIMLISNKKASLKHQTLWFIHQWSCIVRNTLCISFAWKHCSQTYWENTS